MLENPKNFKIHTTLENILVSKTGFPLVGHDSMSDMSQGGPSHPTCFWLAPNQSYIRNFGRAQRSLLGRTGPATHSINLCAPPIGLQSDLRWDFRFNGSHF